MVFSEVRREGKIAVMVFLLICLLCLLFVIKRYGISCRKQVAVFDLNSQSEWMIFIPVLIPVVSYRFETELNSNLSQSQERLEDLH